MKNLKLSKTEYLLYADAPRYLWAYLNDKTDSKRINTFLNHLFEQGKQVQNLAHEYIDKYLIPNQYQKGSTYEFEETKEDGLFHARVDLIIKNAETDKYDIYEIKSSRHQRKST